MKHNLFIISGPSGVGGDDIITGLFSVLPIERVITMTTRQPREGEVDGIDYYFINRAEFLSGISKHQFFEYAQEYNGEYYGVTQSEIERVMGSGKIGIWRLEYKGVITAKKIFPEVITILINAPLAVLERRIRNRSVVSDEFVKERMEYTKEWLKHKDIYDYEVINHEGQLEKTIEEVAAIIRDNLEK